MAKMFKKNNLTTRTILYTISKILSQGITAISAIVFVRLLTTEEYGYVSVYTAWVSVITVFISLRTDGTIQIAQTKYGKDKIDEYASSALTLSLIFFSLICLGAMALIRVNNSVFTDPLWYIALILTHSFGSACLKFRSAYYTIKKEAFKDLIVSVAIGALSFGSALTLVLLLPANKHIGRIAGFAFANIFIAAFFVVIMLKKGKCYFNKEYYKFCLKLSFPLIFSGLSTVVISQLDRLMLEKMVNVEATAIYSFGFNVVQPISIIWYSLNHAWVPEYHEMMLGNELDKIKRHSNNFMFVFTCLACGYILICNELLYIMGTSDYYSAKNILPLMTFYYYLQFLYTFPINYEFYNGNTKLLGIAMALAAIINVILNYVLIPRYEMVGALIASLVSSFFMFVFHDINARFILKNYHYKLSFYLRGIIPFFLTVLIDYLFMDNILVRWGIGIIIGIMLIRHLYKEKAII